MPNLIHHTIHALGPVSHGDIGADSGNVMRFRRIPVLSREGLPIPIPALSAGALRGCARRYAWRSVFDALGLSRETVAGWDRLYAAVCNGGTIEAVETRVAPDTIRERRALMPLLSLFGGALYTSHMASRARVSTSWLVCAEAHAVDLTPEGPPMRAQLADESRVRHIDAEEQSPDVSGVGPMPTTVETVITGAAFAGHASVGGEVEASAWAHALSGLTHVGGKSAAGFGAVRIEHDGDGAIWQDWCATHAERHRAALLALCEDLQPRDKGRGKGKKALPSATVVDDTPPGLF